MAYMRNNNNGRRHHNNYNNRHRQHQHGSGNNQGNQQRRFVNRSNQVFESTGPEGRLRGTAQQLVEKYSALARDATSSGDPVLLQNYWQHAEHYQRLLSEILEENAVFEREREAQRQQHQQTQSNGEAVEIQEGALPDAPVDVTAAPAVEGQAYPAPQQTSRGPSPRHQAGRHAPRPPRESVEEEDHGLPSFLQPPAPPVAAEPVIVERPARTRTARKPVADEGVE